MKTLNFNLTRWTSLLALTVMIYAAGPSAGLATSHKKLKECTHMEGYKGSDRIIEIVIDENYKAKVHQADVQKALWHKDTLFWKLTQTPKAKGNKKIKSYEVKFVEEHIDEDPIQNCKATVPVNEGKKLWPCDQGKFVKAWENGIENETNIRKPIECEIRENALPGYKDGNHGEKLKKAWEGEDDLISNDEEWGYCYAVKVYFEDINSGKAIDPVTVYGATSAQITTMPGGTGNGCSNCHTGSSF